MANKGATTILILNLCLVHFSYAKSTFLIRDGCVLNLNILLSGNLSNFVYTCDCDLGDGRQSPVARAESQIPPAILNSAARGTDAIRCIRKAEQRLLPLCRTRPRRFDRQAKRRLERCIRAEPDASASRRKGKFRFTTTKCRAQLVTFFGAQTGGVWLCACDNKLFDVVTGRAAFITDDSPLGASQELETVRACGSRMLDQMQEVCDNSPRDFGILGLQLLQVCCKRGRVRLSNGKFGCAAVVPDDVSGLKDKI